MPAVLYGPKVKNQNLGIDIKEFEKIYKEAGKNTLVSLELQGSPASAEAMAGKKEKYLVLIHDLVRDPITGSPLHVDLYQPSLEEKIEANIPVILQGESLAVKDLGGTLIKTMSEIKIKALPQDLPKEIIIDISGLKTFEDHILIKDLKFAKGVEILRDSSDIVVSVATPEKVDEELAKPAEDKVEEVKVVGKEKKASAEDIELPASAKAKAGKEK